MKTVDFEMVLDDRLGKIRKVLANKAGEYATDLDRLYNFKRGAGVLQKTPAQVCVAYMTKHLVSVIDLVEKDDYLVSQIDEKLGDLINYCILLEAVLLEAADATPKSV